MFFFRPAIINFIFFFRLCCNNLSLAEEIGLPDSLDSALSSSSLREVDLSYNYNIQLCITQLIKALENSQSKVETLRSTYVFSIYDYTECCAIN